MPTKTLKESQGRESLLKELEEIGEFRRGTLNEIYRRCGKPRCACRREDHPGHGPQFTLTYKEEGRSRMRNLPRVAAAELVQEQIANHARFQRWYQRWREWNEQTADQKLEDVLTASLPPGRGGGEQEKKLWRRSKKR